MRNQQVWVHSQAQCRAFTDISSVLSCEQCAKLLQKARAKKRKLRVHEYKRLPRGHRAPAHSQVKHSSFVTSKVRHDVAPAHKDSTTRIKPRPTFFQNPRSMFLLIDHPSVACPQVHLSLGFYKKLDRWDEVII